jgi:hypothetical protein
MMTPVRRGGDRRQPGREGSAMTAMNKGLLNSMTEAERLLVAETERDAMAALDEDGLLDLHARIRRARTKYVTNYRRGASAAVAARGGRGLSYATNQRDRGKAEVFELALARVSRQVAVVARRAADDLRSERLAAARAEGTGPASGPARRDDGAGRPAGRRPAAAKTTGGTKKDASSRAQGARRQARRDAR